MKEEVISERLWKQTGEGSCIGLIIFSKAKTNQHLPMASANDKCSVPN